MRSLPIAWALLVVLAASPSVAQQGEPAHEPGKVLDVEAKVLDIVGVARGIDAVLKDLGAKVTAQEIRIELSADVLFDFDHAELRADALASLRQVAQVIASTPGAVTIEGHTDGKGADAYNQELSERRAASVKRWLAGDGGIAAARITTRGLGETRPKVPNEKPDGSDDPAGRQQNRRVEITIRKAS